MTHDVSADEWLRQAERDLHAAEHLLQGGFPAHTVVFAHLAVEKALKGLYRARTDERPPVTHDLRYLMERLALPWPQDMRSAVDGLSDVNILVLYAPDRVFGHPVSDRVEAARERLADARVLLGGITAYWPEEGQADDEADG